MDERIRQMIEVWDMAAIKPTPEELCADCPELLTELKQALASLAAADGLLAVSDVTIAADSSTVGQPILIPGYKILHRVGQGGQAVVYAGIKENTGRKVAVKVLLHGAFIGPQGRARFDREVSILAKLQHPNIVTVIDRGVTPDGSLYIVMDFIEGLSLDKHIADPTPAVDPTVHTQGPPDRGLMLVLFSKICDAIQVAHEGGVIHRDLKPSNILIDERCEPHVLDFGVARSALPEENQREVSITDQFLGTLAWASPEQADSRPLDHRTDIYSLGLILYYMLTSGKFPYNVLGPMAKVLNNILQARPIPPSVALAPNPTRSGRAAKREYLPPEPPLNPVIEAIVLKALSKKPEDRFSSAKEMAEAIRTYLSGLGERSPEHAAAPRRRWPWVPVGIGASIALILGVIVQRQMHNDRSVTVPSPASHPAALTMASTDNHAVISAPVTSPASWLSPKAGLFRVLDGKKFNDRTPTLQFFPDGRRLIGWARPNTMVWNLETGDSKEFDDIALLSTDGGWLLKGPAPRFLNTRTWESVRSVDASLFDKSTITDSSYVSFWGSGQVAAIVDLSVPGGRLVQSPTGMTHGLSSDNGRYYVATDKNLLPHIYDGHSMKVLASFDVATWPYPPWAISPDGQMVVIPSLQGDDRTHWVWDWKSGKKSPWFSYRGNDTARAIFLPNGSRVVCIRNDDKNRSISLWDFRDASALIKVWEKCEERYAYFYDVQLSQNGARVIVSAAGSTARVVLVLDVNTGSEICRYPDDDPGRLAISPDGRLAASAGSKKISIWRLPEPNVQQIDHANGPVVPGISP